MSEDPPILDYASPRPRGRVRLPSQSVVRFERTEDGVVVTEVLAGKDAAVWALIFAGFVLLLLGTMIANNVQLVLARHRRFDLSMTIFMCVMWFGEAGLMLAVIQNTWRRTILAAGADGLSLAFVAPFHSQRYAWSPDEVGPMMVMSTGITGHREPLGELVLQGGERVVRLFTDHREADLQPILAAVRESLELDQGPASAAEGTR